VFIKFIGIFGEGIVSDESCSIDVIFIDMAKALDKVPHKRLLEKMKKQSIGG